MMNLMAVYVAVGALAFLVSCSSNRRSRAVGIMFAILLMSFLLNFVAQFWDPAKTVSFLSVMRILPPRGGDSVRTVSARGRWNSAGCSLRLLDCRRCDLSTSQYLYRLKQKSRDAASADRRKAKAPVLSLDRGFQHEFRDVVSGIRLRSRNPRGRAEPEMRWPDRRR